MSYARRRRRPNAEPPPSSSVPDDVTPDDMLDPRLVLGRDELLSLTPADRLAWARENAPGCVRSPEQVRAERERIRATRERRANAR